MAAEPIIEQIVPSGSLNGIKFELMTSSDMEKYSTVNILEASDVTDAKLGLPNASSHCATCGSDSIKSCDGHFGLIKFPATTFHPYLVPEVIQILNRICPGCKSIKQDLRRKVSSTFEACKKSIGEDTCDLESLYKSLRGVDRKLLKKLSLKLSLPKGILSLACFKRRSKRKKHAKQWSAAVGDRSECKYCAKGQKTTDGWYPQVKFKILPIKTKGKRSMSVIAEVNEKLPKALQKRDPCDILPNDYWNFAPGDPQQQGLIVTTIKDRKSFLSRMAMSPSQVFHLLKQLDPQYVRRFVSKRELFFLSCLIVTPNRHRVIEAPQISADGPRLFFDEHTKALRRLVDLSRKFDELQHNQEFGVLASSHVTGRVLECLNMSKLHSKQSESTDSSSSMSGLKWLKDVVLSKRSDNVFRMTVVGDPKLKLDEIGVPLDIADRMFVSDRVFYYNFRKLNEVFNLNLLTKEFLYVRRKGELISLRKKNQLRIGDIFYRPLENGDIVLMNRNPSVHQHSLIAFLIKILPNQSVISINPLCCAPFSADFDGDCFHGFIPQSINCRAELQSLVSIDCQLLNGQDGRSLLSLTHDSLTAAYLLTGCDYFLNKFTMQQFAMLCHSQLPLPAILKAPGLQSPLWTGQQLLHMLLPEMTQHYNRDFLSSLDQSRWLQNTCSDVFTQIFKCYGRKALDIVFAAQDVLCESISMSGFSVSLGDLYLSADAYSRSKLIDEVSCGLEEAESASNVKKILMDPELGFLLMNYDGNGDSFELDKHKNLPGNSIQISKASISAFKDVFHDIQSVVHQHISKDNSMLAMVHAGSKGSLLKLVQQSACLGLQLFPSSLPSKMPLELCFSHQNQHEAAEQCVQNRNFDVVKASFLDGLNPLECFIHALANRSNMFSANAELPGTLTRKLMFHMRDLSVAYDGTVRSAYGNQIVEFCYDIPQKAHVRNWGCAEEFSEIENGNNTPAGEPVGSLAACAISEAAYGALDHPINGLESSPLMNLKNVLEYGQGSGRAEHAISIMLSSKLKRRVYGFEYGALAVKSHLEPIFFSDVVNCVMIVYAARDTQFKKCSPWIMHFHVNKEKMTRKGLQLSQITNGLTGKSQFTSQKRKISLPSLRIRSDNCSLMDGQQECEVCITVAVEDVDACIELERIRDMILPLLLHTTIKGFSEFKRVDILWDTHPDSTGSQGELFLRVFLTDSYLPGKFWSTLVNACIPIMELIDWNRSHPDNISDVSSVHGIDVGWRYFLGNLKSAMSDTGRSIRQEHLLITVDCFSATGQFHGLTAKGLNLLRNRASVSSPFTQACFSKPFDSFVKAAKEGSVDNLCGTIDAMAWGKEAPVGTGGPFDLLFSGKVPEIEKSDGIYKMLSCPELNKSLDGGDEVIGCGYQKVIERSRGKGQVPKTKISSKLDGHPISIYDLLGKRDGHEKILINQGGGDNQCTEFDKNMPNSQTNYEFELKPTPSAMSSLADVMDLSSSLQKILYKYPIDGLLDEDDKLLVIGALHYHPRRNEKVGSGIQEIKVGQHPSYPGTRCYFLVRTDGTLEDMSYRKCVLAVADKLSPKCALVVAKKLYNKQLM